MTDIYALIPVVAIIATFGSIVLVVKYILDYRTSQRNLASQGGAEYRRVAEEAVASQRAMLEEVQKMNKTLAEIERLLREV